VNTAMDKGTALLAFLKATATIRRKRIGSYGPGDKLLWFADVPAERAECRSPFLTDKREDLGGLWLEVRKKRMPVRPPVPQAVADWIRAEDLDQPEKDPELRPEITVLVEQQVQDPGAPPGGQRTVVETAPELRRLADHPEVEDAWLEYLVNKWEPWAKEMRRWQEVQTVYESLDSMRRRVEEAEERYELLLALGLLQWHDPTGTAVTRHILTAPAEVTLDAARGLLTVLPAASFDRFRVELDMLEVQHRPRLNEQAIEAQLDELDVQGWDSVLVAPILREIANCLRADAQVAEETFKPPTALRSARGCRLLRLLFFASAGRLPTRISSASSWKQRTAAAWWLLNRGSGFSAKANHQAVGPAIRDPIEMTGHLGWETWIAFSSPARQRRTAADRPPASR